MKGKNQAVSESNRRRATHKMTKTPTHRVWSDMRQRCLNKNNSRYSDYGGRGIYICSRWDKFESFLEDMGLQPPGMSIGRINNNGPYSKENCRWETKFQQQRNRRGNRLIWWNNRIRTAAEWAEVLGININAFRGRLRKGWNTEKVITYPYKPRKKKQ